MKIQTLMFALVTLMFIQAPLAQGNDFEDSIENEVEAVDPLPEQNSIEESPEQKTRRVQLEEELKRQEKFAKSKREQEVQIGDNVNRYPKQEPLFKKPPGPKQGGVLNVPHPGAAKGLIRIESDGTYRYKTPLREKSQAASFRISSMTPPEISNVTGSSTYESMYGEDNVLGALFDYEWQPFRGFGSLGFIFGTGISVSTGNGTFKNTARTDGLKEAEESYTLYTIPLSLFVNYRFEYVKRQWVVPFINGGITYYGMIETRDDGKSPNIAGAPAMGGGGGLHLSISRLDPANAFTLSEEYDIADMWLTLEARAMKGLYSDTDFTNQSINVGITVDY